MKRVGSVFTLLAMGLACGCTEGDSKRSANVPLLRVHFSGAAHIAKGTNATKVKEALALQSTTNLLNETLEKLARAPQEVWRKSVPAGAADQSVHFRPLVEDLWNSESQIELFGTSQRLDMFIAAEIDDTRAQVWSTNLEHVARGWKLGEIKTEASGWRSASSGLNLHVRRSGKWTLVALTHQSKSPFERLATEISKSGRPVRAFSNELIEVESDWPRLREAFPLAAKIKLPPWRMTIAGRGDHLRTEAMLMYLEKLAVELEPWKIPTNFIGEPLISFTCARGIGPLLAELKGYSQLQLKPPPNQLFSWGLGMEHVQTFFAVPMDDPTNVIKQIAPRLPGFARAQVPSPAGEFLWISNRSEWLWAGLPAIVPHLRPDRAGGVEYIVGGLFPMGIRSNTAPAELFEQVLGRTNLVYYDWELTQERLAHGRQVFQLLDMIQFRRIQSTNVATQRWLLDTRPLMGNTITEVTLTSPKELSLVRKSNFGLTGFELALLGRWLSSPGFPLTYEPPPVLAVPVTNRSGATTTNRVIAAVTNRARSASTNTAPAKTNSLPLRKTAP
jgi:hypothetical protein